MDNAERGTATERANPFDADVDADVATESTPLASLAGRRTIAMKLAPLDTSVQVAGNGAGSSQAGNGGGGQDAPDGRAPRTMKSINIGFADLSYTVKVWRYGNWRRGESCCCVSSDKCHNG